MAPDAITVGRTCYMAYENNVPLRIVEPGKPNQNAYVEPFNRRLRDVRPPTEHWFTTLAHARMAIGDWCLDCDEDRSKRGLSAVLPAVHSACLSSRASLGAKELNTVYSLRH